MTAKFNIGDKVKLKYLPDRDEGLVPCIVGNMRDHVWKTGKVTRTVGDRINVDFGDTTEKTWFYAAEWLELVPETPPAVAPTPKFKIGDTVKLTYLPEESSGQGVRRFIVTSGMKKCLGMQAKITATPLANLVRVSFDGTYYWDYHPDWLELVPEALPSLPAPPTLPPVIPGRKFDIGDEVKVTNLDGTFLYITASLTMRQNIGKQGKVVGFHERGFPLIDFGGDISRWYYANEWLELVSSHHPKGWVPAAPANATMREGNFVKILRLIPGKASPKISNAMQDSVGLIGRIIGFSSMGELVQVSINAERAYLYDRAWVEKVESVPLPGPSTAPPSTPTSVPSEPKFKVGDYVEVSKDLNVFIRAWNLGSAYTINEAYPNSKKASILGKRVNITKIKKLVSRAQNVEYLYGLPAGFMVPEGALTLVKDLVCLTNLCQEIDLPMAFGSPSTPPWAGSSAVLHAPQPLRSQVKSPMTSPLASTLLKLADPKLAKEIAQYTKVEPLNDFEAALKAELERDKSERNTAAAKHVVLLTRKVEANIESLVKDVRRFRAAAEEQLKAIKRIEVAQAYAEETRNYVPLALQLGEVSLHDFRDQGIPTEVPNDWVPASLTKVTAPADARAEPAA